MMNNRKISIGFLTALLLTMVVCLLSCTEKPVNLSLPDGSNLRLNASVTTAAFVEEIQYFVLTVTGPDFTPIVLDSRTPDSTEESGVSSLTWDGHAIYASVSVPVGQNRRFVLEAFDIGPDDMPVSLYRGVTVVSVLAGQMTNVNLLLKPAAPMVRLSPRWLNVGAGDRFEVDVQLANIPNLAGIQIVFSYDRDRLRPVQGRRSATLREGIQFASGEVDDNMRFAMVVADPSLEPLLTGNEILNIGTLVCVSTADVVLPMIDSVMSSISIYAIDPRDTAGTVITDFHIYTDPAEVSIGLLQDRVVAFNDESLEYEVRRQINQDTGAIYLSAALKATYLQLTEYGIEDFTGIENLYNLESLYMDYNSASHLGFLAGLERLRYLSAQSNGLTNISGLTGLMAVQSLNLSYNEIVNLAPLSDMTVMYNLDLFSNAVSNIQPLEGMERLQYLRLTRNSISDIGPLANMRYLYTLELGNNQIVDLTPLRNLSNLQNLSLENNLIEDILPLVENPGIDSGDVVNLWGNSALSSTNEQQQYYISLLRDRQVIVNDLIPGK